MSTAAIWRGSLRRWAFALALVAASLIVLGPVCDAFELARASASPEAAVLAAGGDHQGPCCSSVDDTVSVAATKPAATDPGAMHVASGPRPLFEIAFASPQAGISPHATPPRSLDYHVRSARILS
jgi:hypothetical protein